MQCIFCFLQPIVEINSWPAYGWLLLSTQMDFSNKWWALFCSYMAAWCKIALCREQHIIYVYPYELGHWHHCMEHPQVENGEDSLWMYARSLLDRERKYQLASLCNGSVTVGLALFWLQLCNTDQFPLCLCIPKSVLCSHWQYWIEIVIHKLEQQVFCIFTWTINYINNAKEGFTVNILVLESQFY